MPMVTSSLLFMGLSFYLLMNSLIALKNFEQYASVRKLSKDMVKANQLKYIGLAFIMSMVLTTSSGFLILSVFRL